MMRATWRLVVVFVAIGAVIPLVVAEDPALFDETTVTEDDACTVNPNGEECSISLRQLRGDRTTLSWLQSDASASEEADGGFCCRTPSDENNVCGSCGDTSSELAGNFCNSRGTCADCGGTWCIRRCVLYGSCDRHEKQNVAASGTFCALSPSNCETSCSGTWCEGPVNVEDEEEEDEASAASMPPPLQRPVVLTEADKEIRVHGTQSSGKDAVSRGSSKSDGEATVNGGGASLLQKPAWETEGQIDDDNGEIYAMAPRRGSEEGQIDEDDQEEDESGEAGGESAFANKANATSLLGLKASSDDEFCCYSGQDSNHVCSSCWTTAIAESTNFCAKQDTCGGCGGTWCTYQCVFSGSNPADVCNTAYTTAISPPGHYCTQSRDNCITCKGTYCPVAAVEAVTTSEEPDDLSDTELPPQPGSSDAEDGISLASTASAIHEKDDDELGFCCHAASNNSDVCGTCWPQAKAAEQSWCATKSRCSSCQATWCPAQCVYAGSDPSNICASAYEAAIAPKGDYCAKSEKNCLKCHGVFCPLPADLHA